MNTYNTVYLQKNKSRLGSDFWGLASSFLERVVIPSARIPHDESKCKGKVFFETRKDFVNRLYLKKLFLCYIKIE